MSLPHIILSQLELKGDITEYDVTVLFKKNLGLCWVASHQQVYREMAKLEAAGLCFHTVYPQVGKPDRKVFTITKEGKEALREWQKTKPKEKGYRDELAAKVHSTKNEGRQSVVDVLKDEIESVRKEIEKINKYKPEDVIDQLVIERRISHLKWRKDWAISALAALKA